jgi:peptide/nickel transport system substrate-binding protein
MGLRTLKFRTRRWWRRSFRSGEGLARQSSEQLEKDFFGRLSRLRDVWRPVTAWLLLFLILITALIVQMVRLRTYYQVQQPVAGGIYSEGIVGTFTTANPLYALSDVDTSVSRLIFAGLMTYDAQGKLIGDLADHWSVNSTGTVYMVHLRPNLSWQDGKPLTAADVVFTYQMAQSPDAQSPLQPSWKGVTVAAADSRTVTFTLPNPLSSFPYSLTTGIIPQHLLGSLDPSQIRSAAFNTHPIGAGPFSWGTIGVSGSSNNIEEQLTLLPFKGYWAGEPKLNSFNLYTYANNGALVDAYKRQEVTAMALSGNLPAEITKDSSSHIYGLSLAAGAYVFFKSSNPILNDGKVRQALVAAADRQTLIASLGYKAIPVDEPFLRSQFAYDPAYAQVTGNAQQAKALLDGDGWRLGKDGIRTKGGQPLSFTVDVLAGSDYAGVANRLQAEWKAVGIDAKVAALQPADFQGALASHSYDAVLYGISIGTDPDVFVYWDSSQADIRSANRLNFSEYRSAEADAALEAGRTRLDPLLRAVKYKAFLQAWQRDAPALSLYQPQLLYVSHIPIYGLDATQIATDADRFDNVENWMVHIAWVTR